MRQLQFDFYMYPNKATAKLCILFYINKHDNQISQALRNKAAAADI